MSRTFSLDGPGGPKAAPGKAGTNPEFLGGTRQSILAIRNPDARTVDDARVELAKVERALEWEGLVPTERVYLNRRKRVLSARVGYRSARYLTVGNRTGGLTVDERKTLHWAKVVLQILDREGY